MNQIIVLLAILFLVYCIRSSRREYFVDEKHYYTQSGYPTVDNNIYYNKNIDLLEQTKNNHNDIYPDWWYSYEEPKKLTKEELKCKTNCFSNNKSRDNLTVYDLIKTNDCVNKCN